MVLFAPASIRRRNPTQMIRRQHCRTEIWWPHASQTSRQPGFHGNSHNHHRVVESHLRLDSFLITNKALSSPTVMHPVVTITASRLSVRKDAAASSLPMVESSNVDDDSLTIILCTAIRGGNSVRPSGWNRLYRRPLFSFSVFVEDSKILFSERSIWNNKLWGRIAFI